MSSANDCLGGQSFGSFVRLSRFYFSCSEASVSPFASKYVGWNELFVPLYWQLLSWLNLWFSYRRSLVLTLCFLTSGFCTQCWFARLLWSFCVLLPLHCVIRQLCFCLSLSPTFCDTKRSYPLNLVVRWNFLAGLIGTSHWSPCRVITEFCILNV